MFYYLSWYCNSVDIVPTTVKKYFKCVVTGADLATHTQCQSFCACVETEFVVFSACLRGERNFVKQRLGSHECESFGERDTQEHVHAENTGSFWLTCDTFEGLANEDTDADARSDCSKTVGVACACCCCMATIL